MRGGVGGRRQKARVLDAIVPNQLVIFRTKDQPGVDRLGRFIKPLTGAAHRALVYPWDAATLWRNSTPLVVSGVVRLATDAEIIAFGARAV